MLGPHTEIYGLITPGDWVDFFRHVSEPYEGLLVPETDNRDLKSILIPKVMAAKDKFDIVFQPHYQPPELGDWVPGEDEKLPESPQSFFLRANTGPRWMLGGVMSRPFVTTLQSNGVCAISSIESSQRYDKSLFSSFMVFKNVDHCLCVQEGTLVVRLKDSSSSSSSSSSCVFREGETAVIPAGQPFALDFASRYVRVWSFADGDGIETLVHRLGQRFDGVVLPDQPLDWNYSSTTPITSRIADIAASLGVQFEHP